MASSESSRRRHFIQRFSPENAHDGVRRSACFSPCFRYRYSLTREWDEGETVVFIGLNPSTADHLADDPTLRRCVGFARSWGYAKLTLINLFAYRSTDPSALKRVTDPVGPKNDEVIQQMIAEAALIIVAWGNVGKLYAREQAVFASLSEAHCLGTTKTGSPRHPLYVPAKTVPMLYAP